VGLVTGAASGIGAACVERFRSGGWLTAGLDLRRSAADLAIEVDVADGDAMKDAISSVMSEFGRVEALVTAAGYYEEGVRVEEITRAQWDRMLAVVLGGTVHACKEILPHMLRANSGTVIAISSELALGGSLNDLHYVAAKGAVLGLVKSLAVELADSAVRINAVAPGPTDTPLLAPDSVWRLPEYLDTLPLGRLVRPEEVAATVWHLATEGRMYCGEVLSPNAGAVI
jgi:2-hydroxycyclohexanecarboxyl-CoA dehydrogenase